MNKNDMNASSRTDWERVDALTDEVIDTTDIPPLDEDFFQRVQWRKPLPKRAVAVRLDEETLAWFRSQGNACEEHMAEALRSYVEAHNL